MTKKCAESPQAAESKRIQRVFKKVASVLYVGNRMITTGPIQTWCRTTEAVAMLQRRPRTVSMQMSREVQLF